MVFMYTPRHLTKAQKAHIIFQLAAVKKQAFILSRIATKRSVPLSAIEVCHTNPDIQPTQTHHIKESNFVLTTG